MRKRTYFTLIVLLYSFCLSAQEKNFGIDLHAGLNGSQVGGDGLSGFDKLNLAVGMGVYRPFSEKISGRMEVNFLQKGSRKPADPENNDFTEYKMSLIYAQVPLLLEYQITEKIAAQGGPAFGFLLDSEETDRFGEIQNNPPFNTLDFSGILSVKYDLTEKLSAQVRLDQSLAPIRSRESTGFDRIVGRQYNTVLGIFVSFSIG